MTPLYVHIAQELYLWVNVTDIHCPPDRLKVLPLFGVPAFVLTPIIAPAFVLTPVLAFGWCEPPAAFAWGTKVLPAALQSTRRLLHR